MAKELFRKVALERMSSPEQLDQLITITSPLGWLSLLAIGGLLTSAIFWGIYGSIPTKVQGQGILLRKGGLVSVQTQTSGTLTAINVEVGDIVEEGEIIARIRQDGLLERIREAQLELENFETSFGEQERAQDDANSIQVRQLEQEKTNQNQQIKNLEIQLEAQKTLLGQKQELREGYVKLIAEGIVSKNRVLDVENELVQIKQNIDALELEIEKAKNQLNTLSLEIKKIGSSTTLTKLDYTQQVDKMKFSIRNLQNNFAETSQVISPYSGKVVEIVGTADSLVGQGSTLIILEAREGNRELSATIYYSPFIGKKIQKGMKAQILPTTVKVEEYGFIEGIVIEVDAYPSTAQSVLKTLQNEALARVLAGSGAPIRVKVQLIRDETTPSGYKWSSRQGPPIDINSGTLCSADVTVKAQAPITLVIPILKKYLLGFGDSSDS